MKLNYRNNVISQKMYNSFTVTTANLYGISVREAAQTDW